MFPLELIGAPFERARSFPLCSSDPSPVADAEKARAEERQRAEQEAKLRERRRVGKENLFLKEGAKARGMQWEELSQVHSMWQCAHCTTWVLPAPHDGTNRVLDVLDAKAGRGEGCPNAWGEEANAAPPIVKRTAKAVFPCGYGLAALAAAYEHVPSTVISLPVLGECQGM